MSGTRIVGAIFLAVGILIAGAGAFCYWGTQDLLNNGLRSTGKVVELRKGPTDRYFMPVVQFQTADNQIITAVGKTGSNPPSHKVDDTVTVIYRATSPEDIVLDDFFELWFLTSMFGGMGLIFVIIGGGMLIYSRRKAR